MSVLCLVEHDRDGAHDASLRALSFARTLAQSSGEAVVAALFGQPSPATLEALSAFGVPEAYAIDPPELASYAPVAWAKSLAELAPACSATAIAAAGTDRGNEVMAHAGALTGLPMVANCFSAERSSETTVRLSRQRWAGSLIEDAVCEASPALMTVAFDGVEAVPAPAAVATALSTHRPSLGGKDLEVKVARWLDRSSGISLADARVVIGGGRGVGGPEGFAPIEELAGLLGAAVGVSRVVTSLGWRSHNQQVGQTGTRISPDLYLACGISGAIQHLAGCQSAKHVVAINTDPDAPIMSRADYAVVGDLSVIVPALVDAIRARGSRSSGP